MYARIMLMIDTKHEENSEKSQTYHELRQNTFNLLLLGIGGSTAVLIWLTNINVRASKADIVLLWLALEAICFLCYLLRRSYFSAAIGCFIAGLWLCNAFAAAYYGLAVFLNLFALISLAASVLTTRLPALLLTVLSTIFIIALGGGQWSTDFFLFPLLMLWFTLFMGLIAFHSLYTSLDVAWNYQKYAIQQMMAARDHRGNLMQVTKTLNEVR